MPQNHSRDRKVGTRAWLCAALSGATAVALISASTVAARAGDDDVESPSVIGKVMEAFGLRSANSGYDGINYDERSPLVVPPTRDLPPPQTDAAAPVPNWPKDPDITRRKSSRIDGRSRYQKDYVVESSRALRPDELNVPGAPGSSGKGDGDATANSQMSDPTDRGTKKSLFNSLGSIFQKEQYATFTGEPSRSSLTDPPPGYLTPSPDQPYGIGQEKAKYHIDKPSEHGELTR
jgi:hypothetical protein